jgi:hypothetical protein
LKNNDLLAKRPRIPWFQLSKNEVVLEQHFVGYESILAGGVKRFGSRWWLSLGRPLPQRTRRHTKEKRCALTGQSHVTTRAFGHSVKRLRRKCFLDSAFPQRLEAAIDSAAVTARVELVPFPNPARIGVFQRTVSACFVGSRSSSRRRIGVHRKSIQRRQYFWRRALLWWRSLQR